MNSVVLEKKKKIDAACTSCFRQLVGYCDQLKKHNQDVQRISQSLYVDYEKARQISELEVKTKTQIVTFTSAINDQIEEIRVNSESIADIPMESVDLSAVGTLTSLIGNATSTEAGSDIFEQLLDYANMYRGQPKALKVIRVAMERSGNPDPNVLSSKYGGSLIFSVTERIRRLENVADNLQHSPNINHAFDMARELEVYAYNMGVDLTSSFKKMMNAVNPDDYNDLYFARLASLIGVNDQV